MVESAACMPQNLILKLYWFMYTYTNVTNLMVESAACMSHNLLFVVNNVLFHIYVYICNQSNGRICGIDIRINPVTIFGQRW
jgi:hypothetical protein